MNRVINLSKRSKKEDYVYIGREWGTLLGSKWGNPFHVGKHGTREEVLEKYEAYVRSRPDLIAALPELKDKILACWCKPLACHGDVLARLVEEIVK